MDTAIRAGERVPPDYDPLIAKIMAVGPDRGTAIDRMRRALDEVAVTGIQTTLPFDRALFRDPAFASGDISTDWVETHWDGEASRRDALPTAAQVAAGAAETPTTGSRVARGASAASGTSATARETTASLRKDIGGGAWAMAGRAAAIDRWPR